MTNKEFFEKTLKEEIPRFDKVFKAMPEKLKDWRAHPKNRNTEEIMTVVVNDAMSMPVILETGEFDFGEEDAAHKSKSTSEMTEELKENLESTAKLASKMSDEEWDEPAKLLMNGKSMWEATRGEAAWGVIFDMIHHRGQLSTHIRPQGGKVPAIYGSSGDDTGM